MPWEIRVPAIVDESESRPMSTTGVVCIAVSSSARNGVVGCGGAIEMPRSLDGQTKNDGLAFCSTLGTREEQNPFSGELAAVADALVMLPKLRFRRIVLLTRNRAAALAQLQIDMARVNTYLQRINASSTD